MNKKMILLMFCLLLISCNKQPEEEKQIMITEVSFHPLMGRYVKLESVNNSIIFGREERECNSSGSTIILGRNNTLTFSEN